MYLWRDSQGTLLHDIQASKTTDSVRRVSGLFQHDTLLMVWEDFRYGDGLSDIYSNFWLLPNKLVSDHPMVPNPDVDLEPEKEEDPVESGQSKEVEITALIPNPAREVAEIKLQLTLAAAAQLYVYDAMGRQVWSKEGMELKAGTSTVMMDVVGLGPGTYTVVAQAQGKVSRQRLIVLH
jgi:hypothetical protein